MDIINFSNLESQVLSLFNSGKKTFDDINEIASIAEKTLTSVLEGLISKNILKLNQITREYEYQTKVNDEIVILDGNLLLPTTIIKLKDKMFITRGEWYEFPIDFDIRRIIWNVKLETKTNSTLVDLIRTSVLKEKKSKIVQLPEYTNLCNKIVPYSPTIGLLIHCVGEIVTDISIIFKIKINKSVDVTAEHRGFTVRSEISTEELIKTLNKPVAERKYQEEIKINQIHNFSDFIFSKNEIPISLSNNELTFIKITGIKKSFEITYFKMDVLGNIKKLDVESFDDSNEAIEKLRDIFKGFPSLILSENNFMSEMTE
jgi:hypothetical protein